MMRPRWRYFRRQETRIAPTVPPVPSPVLSVPPAAAAHRVVAHADEPELLSQAPVLPEPGPALEAVPSPLLDDVVAPPHPTRVVRPTGSVLQPRPQPLPRVFLPLVRALVPDPQRVAAITGAETRHALQGAGAMAATTGTMIHLPDVPRPTPRDLGVVAHELSHVADEQLPTTIPPATSERRARQVGTAVQAASALTLAVPDSEEPIRGGNPEPGDRSVEPLSSKPPAMTSPMPSPSARVTSPLPRAAATIPVAKPAVHSRRAAPLRTVASSRVGQPLGRPAPPGNDVGHRSAAASPHFLMGLPDIGSLASQVGELPVGGVASAVRGAMQSPLLSALTGSRQEAGVGGESAQAAPASLPSGAGPAGADPAPDSAPMSPSSSPAMAAPELAQDAGIPPDPGVQVLSLVEALEERVLAELERRGGRYAGVF
ncbi:MAG: DUF4157 domain-containing protein [bacterium]|nr:DUF4157 domain-containing protein [bacterium]